MKKKEVTACHGHVCSALWDVSICIQHASQWHTFSQISSISLHSIITWLCTSFHHMTACWLFEKPFKLIVFIIMPSENLSSAKESQTNKARCIFFVGFLSTAGGENKNYFEQAHFAGLFFCRPEFLERKGFLVGHEECPPWRSTRVISWTLIFIGKKSKEMVRKKNGTPVELNIREICETEIRYDLNEDSSASIFFSRNFNIKIKKRWNYSFKLMSWGLCMKGVYFSKLIVIICELKVNNLFQFWCYIDDAFHVRNLSERLKRNIWRIKLYQIIYWKFIFRKITSKVSEIKFVPFSIFFFRQTLSIRQSDPIMLSMQTSFPLKKKRKITLKNVESIKISMHFSSQNENQFLWTGSEHDTKK